MGTTRSREKKMALGILVDALLVVRYVVVSHGIFSQLDNNCFKGWKRTCGHTDRSCAQKAPLSLICTWKHTHVSVASVFHYLLTMPRREVSGHEAELDRRDGNSHDEERKGDYFMVSGARCAKSKFIIHSQF